MLVLHWNPEVWWFLEGNHWDKAFLRSVVGPSSIIKILLPKASGYSKKWVTSLELDVFQWLMLNTKLSGVYMNIPIFVIQVHEVNISFLSFLYFFVFFFPTFSTTSTHQPNSRQKRPGATDGLVDSVTALGQGRMHEVMVTSWRSFGDQTRRIYGHGIFISTWMVDFPGKWRWIYHSHICGSYGKDSKIMMFWCPSLSRWSQVWFLERGRQKSRASPRQPPLVNGESWSESRWLKLLKENDPNPQKWWRERERETEGDLERMG